MKPNNQPVTCSDYFEGIQIITIRELLNSTKYNQIPKSDKIKAKLTKWRMVDI